jgi:hypothetical protein
MHMVIYCAIVFIASIAGCLGAPVKVTASCGYGVKTIETKSSFHIYSSVSFIGM